VLLLKLCDLLLPLLSVSPLLLLLLKLPELLPLMIHQELPAILCLLHQSCQAGQVSQMLEAWDPHPVVLL
jgi:hypothetical protein